MITEITIECEPGRFIRLFATSKEAKHFNHQLGIELIDPTANCGCAATDADVRTHGLTLLTSQHIEELRDALILMYPTQAI